MSLINSYLKQHQKEAKEKGMILIPNREMSIAQHIRECETLDEGTEYLYGVLINMKIGIEKRIEEKTPTEDEVSKYWYNKGHEDGRKLVTVNTLTVDEIMLVIRQTSFADGYLNDNLIRFARAILLRASEK